MKKETTVGKFEMLNSLTKDQITKNADEMAKLLENDLNAPTAIRRNTEDDFDSSESESEGFESFTDTSESEDETEDHDEWKTKNGGDEVKLANQEPILNSKNEAREFISLIEKRYSQLLSLKFPKSLASYAEDNLSSWEASSSSNQEPILNSKNSIPNVRENWETLNLLKEFEQMKIEEHEKILESLEDGEKYIKEASAKFPEDELKGASDAKNCRKEFNQEPILNSTNEAPKFPSLVENQWSGSSLNVPNSWVPFVPVYPPLHTEHNILSNWQTLNWLEKLPRAQTEIMEPKKILESLEDGEKEKPCYLHYGGLSVEDVKGVTNLGIEFTETQNFYNFVESYVLKRNNQKYDSSRLRMTTFDMSRNFRPVEIVPDDLIRTSERITTDLKNGTEKFKIPRFKYEKNKKSNQQLCEDLVMNEQYLDAIKVLKFNIYLNSDDYLNVLLLTDLYMHEHCYYQACQTLFTWLKNNQFYRDIVPPFFVMEDKDCGIIEKKQLKDLQKMFIKAAQRDASPEFPVQAALAKLSQMDGDYKTAIECLVCIGTAELLLEKDPRCYYWKSFCEILLLGDTSVVTLDHVYNNFNKEDINIEFITKIGLEYLLRKRYRTAYLHLSRVVRVLIEQGYKEPRDTLLANSWARLRLCFELMADKNLCKAVDQRDLEEVKRIMIWRKVLFIKYILTLLPLKTLNSLKHILKIYILTKKRCSNFV